ncbi:MAG TPA: hypothetical protein GXX40_05990 [Firmicutes bacterium]|nr:hypothetical protein [Bacillota bacterium]
MEEKPRETPVSSDKTLVETVVSALAEPGPESRNLIAGLGLLAVLSIISLLHGEEMQSNVAVEPSAASSSKAVDATMSAVAKLLGSKGKAAPDPAIFASMIPLLNQLLSQRTASTQDAKKEQALPTEGKQ